MKILFFLRSEFGSAGAAASYMIPTIASSLYDVEVVALCKEKSTEKKTFSNAKMPVSLFLYENIEEAGFYAIEKIKFFSPDLVYIFGMPDPFFIIYNIRHVFPSVYIIYDVRSPLLSGNDKRREEIKWEYKNLELYVDLLLSSDVGAINTYFDFIGYNYDTLPIGIDMPRIDVKKNYSQLISNFVFVGSLDKKRKIDVLLKEFIKFSSKVKHSVSLDIIGDGSSKNQLQQLLASLPGGKCVNFVGFLPQQEVFNRLKNYDCGIAYVPYEGYNNAPSLKSIEYAAAKLPILASDTNAHQAYNEQHGFSFKFISNKPDQMADDILRLVYEGFSESDIEASFEAALKFDWQAIFNKVLHPVFSAIEESHGKNLKSVSDRCFKRLSRN